jgi:hypothetical protein
VRKKQIPTSPLPDIPAKIARNCPWKQNVSVSTFAEDAYPPSQQIYILNPHIPNLSSTRSGAIKHFNHGAFAKIAGT